MLEKMGWREGEGLGANRQGISTPLAVQKTDARSGVIVQAAPAGARGAGAAMTEVAGARGLPPAGPATRVVLLKNMVGGRGVWEGARMEAFRSSDAWRCPQPTRECRCRWGLGEWMTVWTKRWGRSAASMALSPGERALVVQGRGLAARGAVMLHRSNMRRVPSLPACRTLSKHVPRATGASPCLPSPTLPHLCLLPAHAACSYSRSPSLASRSRKLCASSSSSPVPGRPHRWVARWS